ncbi:acyl carrier protein [Actinokineospora sp. PR83]|uniref:acyl carrier protein n=1 Tax=Actinokineospora sp. PR83 TaxID=2884908 RepID=UPI001F1E3DC1|nr:acyl carrier protein [Actinokineospora sp. PR83]MCG8917198.1 acyl carrier protein [Actinokineospora sp. PR83]
MESKISDEMVKRVTLDIVVDELELDVEADEVNLTADLVDEYEADSLGLIQVLARVNKELAIRLPREEAVDLRTVDALVRRIIQIRDGEGAVNAG